LKCSKLIANNDVTGGRERNAPRRAAIWREDCSSFRSAGVVLRGLCPRPPLAFSVARRFRKPKGEVARQYQAYRASDGVCERALLALDRSGTIAWSYRSPIAVNPGAGGVRSGVNAIPTFFINGVRNDGAYDYASPVAGTQMHTAADTST
jgi:hypothetical protein